MEGGEDMQVDKVGRRKTKILSWGEGEDEDEVRRASGEPAAASGLDANLAMKTFQEWQNPSHREAP